ncbi:MAG TPA: hypothetical protein P5105_06835, partial [Victivallales bacterium]|nr:hypothetical protein [Victivallales bacterium]
DDEGKTENTENGGSTSEQIASSQLSADEKIAAGREAAAKRGILTKETEEILGNTSWDGNPIEKTNNSNVIDQMSKAELAAVGLPTNPTACMFFSIAYGAADALGVTLTPEEAGKVYEYAKNQKPPSIGINSEGKPSAYWVNSFPGIVDAVAAVKKVDASNISIPKAVIPCSSTDGQKVTGKIIEALKSGGSAEIRYGADPNKSTSSAHSMRVTGSFIENGKVILSIKDTAAPTVKTYVDTSTMELYTLKYNKKTKINEKVISDRPVSSYLPITKVKKEGE